jgi:hypothetical protein
LRHIAAQLHVLQKARAQEEGLRSFHLYIGHRHCLTVAGSLLFVLSIAASVALSVTAGPWLLDRRVPSALAYFYPVGILACALAGSLMTWGVGVGLSRLSGVPLVVPLPTKVNGTVRLSQKGSRRPLQFSLAHLQWVVLLVAALCALARLDIVQLGLFVYLAGMLLVITLGTGIVLARRRPSHPRDYLIHGGLAGSCLGAVCLGWVFVVVWIIKPSTRPLWMLGIVTTLGAMIGVIVGLAMFAWQWWRAFRR